jgi:hypothetical protein
MKEPYLEVTFRRGHPLAAYLYLPRQPDDKSHRTSRVEPGLVIDFTAPTKITVGALNKVLQELGQRSVTQADLAPLRAA